MRAGGKVYDFDKPIRIVGMKSGGLDVMFYSGVFAVVVAAVFFVLCLKDGTFGVYLDLWRVLVSIPLIVLALVPLQLLKELREYPPRLAKKATWTREELMALTGKDQKETERLITRVLESAFLVDPSCEKQV